MRKGWLSLGGKKYYLNKKTGVMLTGWQLDSNKQRIRFFRLSDGSMLTGFWKDSKGRYRYFDPRSGHMQRGWMKDEKGNKYYFSSSTGYMFVGWINSSNGKKRYFDSKTGVMKTGWYTEKKNGTYYLDPSTGYMLTGIRHIDSKTYYLDPVTGKKVTGIQWITVDGAEYYLDKNGAAVTGKQIIDGVLCDFDENGKRQYNVGGTEIESDCALLIDAGSGEILLEKCANEPHANASTTKLLTAILVVEKCKLDEIVDVSYYAASQEPSKLYMREGDSFYVKDLLYSLLLASNNDTAVALAEHVSGTEAKFARLMNQKAKKLGCVNTHFVTANGLDAGRDHYTTAKDLAKIAQYALKKKTIASIVKTSQYSFDSRDGYGYTVFTTNALLGKEEGCIGMKTGYTNKAGHCFVGAVKGKNGHTYISVILGGKSSDQRWEEARAMIRYARNLES